MRLFASLLATSLLAGTMAPPPARAEQPSRGWLILSGGGEEIAPPDAIARFRELAGGAGATIVFIPTASSGLRLPTGEILDVPPAGPLGADAARFAGALARLFGVRRVVLLHTRNRSEAETPEFVRPLLDARAVWISSGNAGRLIDSYLDTRTMRALARILDRDGVIGGNSAGAIIQGSYTVRGRSDKPVLMVPGRERGFAFLPRVAINPHVAAAHREDELVTVVDWHPELLGLGIDTGAAAMVRNGALMPLGTGRVAIYDNVRRDGRWYYWLRPGTCLSIDARRAGEEICLVMGGAAVERSRSSNGAPMIIPEARVPHGRISPGSARKDRTAGSSGRPG